jgi:o-succinylbenzoate synthase
MKASYKRYVLNFKKPSGTSRGIMHEKETWFLILCDKSKVGIGECGLLRGLSSDDVPDYEARLQWICEQINTEQEIPKQLLRTYPSIRFGLEQAMLSLEADTPFTLFPSDFVQGTKSIPINGLVWMGDEGFMHEQITQKLSEGFSCLKMKIGAIDFTTEIKLLASIRKQYSRDKIELRVDANGAFQVPEAPEKLAILAQYDLHSIEQPLARGQWAAMAQLSRNSPIPIALDEELIGVYDVTEKEKLLQMVKPQYIVIKPSLVGGFQSAQEWIDLAEKYDIKWWITSALESNVGLNAIAQWTYTKQHLLPQGLGTGGLYTNNFDSPLEVAHGHLFYRKNKNWKSNLIADLCI